MLLAHSSVRQAAVLTHENAATGRELVAYVVFDVGQTFQPAGSGDFPVAQRNTGLESPVNRQAGKPALHSNHIAALRKFLEEKLPAHLCPALFVALEQLPLTPNGKVDRRALPAPDAKASSTASALVSPRNAVEESLHALWRELLGRNSFGVHENFFHLGGHSLLAMQLVARIGRTFQIELPVRALFESPTIAGIAEAIAQSPRAATAGPSDIARRLRPADAERLLAGLDQLSDAEVEALLGSPTFKSVVS